jgi:transposase
LTGSSLGGKSQCRICEDVLLRARRSTTERSQQKTRGNSRRRAWRRRRRTGQRHDIDADDDPVFALQKGTEALQLQALLLLLDELLALLLQHEILLLFSERRRARLESTLQAASKSASAELLGYRCTLLGRQALQDL